MKINENDTFMISNRKDNLSLFITDEKSGIKYMNTIFNSANNSMPIGAKACLNFENEKSVDNMIEMLIKLKGNYHKENNNIMVKDILLEVFDRVKSLTGF